SPPPRVPPYGRSTRPLTPPPLFCGVLPGGDGSFPPPPAMPKPPSRSPHRPARERRSRRGTGSITLADVAKLAGVSAITASRALNTPDRVSPDALQRVREAVERTGYVPNMPARPPPSTPPPP